MSDLWAFVSDEVNRTILAWFGGGLVIFASGAWAVIKFLATRRHQAPPPSSTTNSIYVGDDSTISGIISSGNVSIEKFVQTNTTELVKILTYRAEIINRDLSKFYHYANIQNYLGEFNKMHEKHIHALDNANLSLAHEILSEIHQLSFNLEKDEFWESHHVERPYIKYSLRLDAFTRGRMIDGYIVGEIENFSELYPSEYKDIATHGNYDELVDKSASEKDKYLKLYRLVIQSYYDKDALKDESANHR